MLFAHDTEVALQAAAALVNTASPDAVETLDTVADLEPFVAAGGGPAHANAPRRSCGRCRISAHGCARSGPRTRTRSSRSSTTLLRDAQALPQLVKHDEWPYHLHAWSPDTRLADRMAVEAAMAVVDVVRTEELDRLRVCAADDCEDVVVDLSKNRSRRFCDSGCGNRANVKAYRARQRGTR